MFFAFFYQYFYESYNTTVITLTVVNFWNELYLLTWRKLLRHIPSSTSFVRNLSLLFSTRLAYFHITAALNTPGFTTSNIYSKPKSLMNIKVFPSAICIGIVSGLTFPSSFVFILDQIYLFYISNFSYVTFYTFYSSSSCSILKRPQ